jgi:hypothetical protein
MREDNPVKVKSDTYRVIVVNVVSEKDDKGALYSKNIKKDHIQEGK